MYLRDFLVRKNISKQKTNLTNLNSMTCFFFETLIAWFPKIEIQVSQ